MFEYLTHASLLASGHAVVIGVVIPWVLMTKRNSTAAVAWCLVVLLMPYAGALLFWFFGYNHIYGPLRRRRSQRAGFHHKHPPRSHEASRGRHTAQLDHPTWNHLGRIALEVDAFPVSPGNTVTVYADTVQAFDAKLAAIEAARQHVHLEYFIFRPDSTGLQMLSLLTSKAKAGVQVRLLYDWIGGFDLRRRWLKPLLAAGGQAFSFLPLNPLRARLQINMRNHRKVVVVDGRLGFIGGMNIGDEYLGKKPKVGYWRDEVLRLEGPAVAGLQRIFAEDWNFASQEELDGPGYFPELAPQGTTVVQLIESGPEQDVNAIREIYFAAILSAQEHVYLASPYFVPDQGLFDALRLARLRGVAVRLLTLLRPDHLVSFYAGRYYYADLLEMGVEVYQYRRGMMHSKMILVDGQWGIAGSANFDNRSLHLNFEASCIVHTSELVVEMEASFLRDLEDSERLLPEVFARRSFGVRLVENACRLFSPIL